MKVRSSVSSAKISKMLDSSSPSIWAGSRSLRASLKYIQNSKIYKHPKCLTTGIKKYSLQICILTVIFHIRNRRLSKKGRHANFRCILKDSVKYVCICMNKDKDKIHKGEPDCLVTIAIYGFKIFSNIPINIILFLI